MFIGLFRVGLTIVNLMLEKFFASSFQKYRTVEWVLVLRTAGLIRTLFPFWRANAPPLITPGGNKCNSFSQLPAFSNPLVIFVPFQRSLLVSWFYDFHDSFLSRIDIVYKADIATYIPIQFFNHCYVFALCCVVLRCYFLLLLYNCCFLLQSYQSCCVFKYFITSDTTFWEAGEEASISKWSGK